LKPRAEILHTRPNPGLTDKIIAVNGLEAQSDVEDFSLTSTSPNPNIQSHTGFGGCDAVESDSPMYITLLTQGVRKMLTPG
jgi:hypothetical protein